uniref:Transposase (Putative), gypsy type n=1 Tax=Tanacetum cinerariifolium TaxID=118510 RepID=A0A6L2JEM1_TANCI|nr:transposase (putative), gypsy type [Tanacetum cinerariifolium]
MSTILDVRCVLSQKAFDAFCEKFHIPEEVHPVLPDRGNTMHERPAGKIGYFRINIFQLSVIGAAKVFHFEILCRVYGVTPTVGLFRCFYVNSKKNGWMSFIKRSDRSPVCYTKPLDSLKNWNDHFFWVDDFACPVRFSWHTAKNVTMDPAPVAADFNVQDYATLVAHPSPFQKFLEEFLYLVGLSRNYTLDEETYPLFFDKDGKDMDIFAFIHTSDPTKVKVVERERKEDESRLLETTVGRTVPLVPVAPDHNKSELDASVDKLFDEGGSCAQTEQGDSAGGRGEQGINIQPITETIDVVVENAEVKGEPIPTMPFVTSSVSATPGREGEGHIDSVTRRNLRTISAPQRFVISSDSSHHSGANIAEAEVDSFARPSVPVITAATTTTSNVDPDVVIKEKIIEPSLVAADSTSAGGTDPVMAGLTDLTGSDFLVGGIHTVINPDSDLQKSYARGEKIENLKAQLLLKEAEAAEAIRLRTKASKLETAKKSLRDEVTALNERNTILEKERNVRLSQRWLVLEPP